MKQVVNDLPVESTLLKDVSTNKFYTVTYNNQVYLAVNQLSGWIFRSTANSSGLSGYQNSLLALVNSALNSGDRVFEHDNLGEVIRLVELAKI